MKRAILFLSDLSTLLWIVDHNLLLSFCFELIFVLLVYFFCSIFFCLIFLIFFLAIIKYS